MYWPTNPSITMFRLPVKAPVIATGSERPISMEEPNLSMAFTSFVTSMS